MSDSYKIYASQDYVDSKGLPDGASANQQLVTDKDGVVKWEEKPFFHAEYGEDITWDGDTTGMETFELQGGVFYKVSETIYTPDKMVGRKYAVMNDGTAISNVVTADMISTLPEYPDLYFVIYNTLPVFCFGPACESLSFPGGVFFLNINGSNYTNYLSNSIVKKIDPFYIPLIPAEKLPDSIYSVVAQKTFEGSFDKVTVGRDTFIFNAYDYYKISEFAPKREYVISFSGTRANGDVYSTITEGENCCAYGFFIVVYQAGECTLESRSFNAPSAGLYACYSSDNYSMTAGTYNFTYKFMSNIIQSSTTFKRYYLDVDNSGALIVAEVSE